MNLNMVLRVALVSLLLIIPLGIFFIPSSTAIVLGGLFFIGPLWIPFVLAALLVPLWLTHIRSQYVASIPYVVFELKPGEHTPKTAHAMELVFYSLHHRIAISRVTEILTGQIRMPWSFEITASKGVVRFFMRVPQSQRQAVELRLRSEYRDIDLDEIRDYAREVSFDPVSMKMKMREYVLAKPDPYPLKTYDRYESENATGPFSQLLDTLVEVGEEEHVYISYIIRPHQRARKRIWQEETTELHTDASAEIAKILGPGGDPRQLPKKEQVLVGAIEEALKKPSFDCGVRALYFAPKGRYSAEKADGLDTLFSDFSDEQLNEFQPYSPRERIFWPLTDVFAALPWLEELFLFNVYRRRAFFMPPYYGNSLILNTAELATIFHLPFITRSSALSRGRGNRLEPPDNLPV